MGLVCARLGCGADGRGVIYNIGGAVNFQPHHQPYNLLRQICARNRIARASPEGLEGPRRLLRGTLPAVVFVKPDGTNNQHPGESTMAAGDLMAGTIVETLRRSPQWTRTAIIVMRTVASGTLLPRPKATSGAPARVSQPSSHHHSQRRFVDHTIYDTTSILQFLSKRFGLELLPGIRTQFGDLRSSFTFGR